jgi:hypothetical protein
MNVFPPEFFSCLDAQVFSLAVVCKSCWISVFFLGLEAVEWVGPVVSRLHCGHCWAHVLPWF